VRWRRRATAKAPAPTPSDGRSSNTRPASRQYFPRVDEEAKTRLPPSSGDTSVSLVSSLTRSSIVPDRATEVNATSGTRHASATVTIPARRRVRIDTTPRASPMLIAKPAASRTTIISTTSRPKSPATASFASSGWRLFEKGSFESAQAPTAPAASDGTMTTGRLRRRSGTIASHTIAAIAAAPSAPRDWVRRMASTLSPTAG
jgi:hypothetical protein